LNFLKDRHTGRQGQAATAVFLGNQRRQISRLGQRLDKGRGILPVTVAGAPIVAREPGTQGAQGLANIVEGGAQVDDGAGWSLIIHGAANLVDKI